MKFSELVLISRKHLSDIRKTDLTIITDASEDGIRWTSDDLIDLCKNGVVELMRILKALKLKNNYNLSVQTRLVTGKIKVSGIFSAVTGDTEDIDTATKVLKIQGKNLDDIYNYEEPDKFFGKNYLITGDSSSFQEKVFTQYYDVTNNKTSTVVLPSVTEEKTALIFCYYSLESLCTLDSTKDLPFIEINDILFDIIERRGRRIEYNPNEYKLLTETINNNLSQLVGQNENS